MAKNLIVNGNSYNAVPYIAVPKADGSGDAFFWDTTDATASAASILAGYAAYGSNGKISGQATVPTISQDSSTKVLRIS